MPLEHRQRPVQAKRSVACREGDQIRGDPRPKTANGSAATNGDGWGAATGLTKVNERLPRGPTTRSEPLAQGHSRRIKHDWPASDFPQKARGQLIVRAVG